MKKIVPILLTVLAFGPGVSSANVDQNTNVGNAMPSSNGMNPNAAGNANPAMKGSVDQNTHTASPNSNGANSGSTGSDMGSGGSGAGG